MIRNPCRSNFCGNRCGSTKAWWKPAIKVLKKVNGKLRFLYRQGKYLNPRLRRMLCNTLIQPHFDFACSAWYPNLTQGLKTKLQIAQNKCIRYCLFLGNREGIRYKHLKRINWLPVAERVKQFIAASVFKFFNNLAPRYMKYIFIKSERVRTTRSSNESNLYIPFRKNEYGKTVFLTWEQLFGIASMPRLVTLKLVILLIIRLRKNIS